MTAKAAQDRDGDQISLADIDKLQEQLDQFRTIISGASDDKVDGAIDSATANRLVREILRSRRHRESVFGDKLFGEPAWDILLELYAAELNDRKLSVSSVCYASAVPATTALRWIERLEKEAWLRREFDPTDGRRSWVFLTERASAAMRRYLNRMAIRPVPRQSTDNSQ